MACSWVRARSESPRRDPREPFSPPDSPKRCYRPEDRSSSAGRGPWTSADDPSPSPRSIPRSSELLARRATGALHVLMGADHLCALAGVAAPGEADLRSAEQSLFAGRRGAAARGRRCVADVPRLPERARARTPTGTLRTLRTSLRASRDVSEVTRAGRSVGRRARRRLSRGVRGVLLRQRAGLAGRRRRRHGQGRRRVQNCWASSRWCSCARAAEARARRAHPDDALVNAAADLQPPPRGGWTSRRGASDSARRRNRQAKLGRRRPRRWRFGRAAPRMRARTTSTCRTRTASRRRRASLRLFRRRATEKTKGSKLMTTYRSLPATRSRRTSSADGRPFQSMRMSRVRRERERERERNANARRRTRARGGPSP